MSANYFSDDQGSWYATTLWAHAADPRHTRTTVDVAHLTRNWEPPTDMSRVLAADLSYPILLTPDGWICDGYHRTLHANMLGLPTLHAIILQDMPPSDDVVEDDT